MATTIFCRRWVLLLAWAVGALIPLLAGAEDATTQPDGPPVSQGQLAAEARFGQCMRRPISIDTKDEPFERVLARVSRQAAVPISIDRNSRWTGQPNWDCRISLHLQQVPADRVLKLMLQCALDSQAGDGRVYIDADGAHIVADLPPTETYRADKAVEVRYDVSDLVRALRVNGRSSSTCFDDLQQLIVATVASETWSENGGQVGTMRVAPLHPPPSAATDDPDNPPRGGSDPHDPFVVTTAPRFQAEIADLFSSLRGGLAGALPTVPAGVARTDAALRRPIPATFRLLPLGTVLDSIRRTARINLFVDWIVLRDYGITPGTLVSLPVPPNGMLPAGDVLSGVCKALGDGENTNVGIEMDTDGVVEVRSVAPNRKTEVVTCCYNIRGLLQTHRPSKLWSRNESADQRGDEITKELTNRVATDSWRETGGNTGSIHILGPVLVVTQTALNQERVAEFLQRLP